METNSSCLSPLGNATFTEDNNSCASSSLSLLRDINYQIFIVVLSIFSVLGIVTNSVVVAIYVPKVQSFVHNATNYFILHLAFIDLTVSSLVMPFMIFYELLMVHNMPLCKLLQYIAHTTSFSSVLTFGIIAIDRYLATCKPHKYKIYFQRKAKHIIAGTLIMSLVFSVPAIFERREFLDGRRKYCFGDEDSKAAKAYSIFMAVVFCCVIVTALFLYTLVFYAILGLRRRRSRQVSTSGLHQHVWATRAEGRKQCPTQNSKSAQDQSENKNKRQHGSAFSAKWSLNTIAMVEARCQGLQHETKGTQPGLRDSTPAEKNVNASCQDNVKSMRIQPASSNELSTTRRHGNPMLSHEQATTSKGGDKLLEDEDDVIQSIERRVVTDKVTAQEQSSNKTSHGGPIKSVRFRQITAKANGARQGTSTSELHHSHLPNLLRTATMLFGVTAVFILSWLPYGLGALHFIPYYPQVSFLFYINNCTNVFVFTATRSSFRNDLKKLKNKYTCPP